MGGTAHHSCPCHCLAVSDVQEVVEHFESARRERSCVPCLHFIINDSVSALRFTVLDSVQTVPRTLDTPSVRNRRAELRQVKSPFRISGRLHPEALVVPVKALGASIALDKHLTVNEVAKLWHMHPSTIRRIFGTMEGVIKLGAGKHKTLYIPERLLVTKHRELAG